MKKIVAIALPVLLLIPLTLVEAQQFNYVNNWLNQLIYWLRLAITVIMILMTFWFLLNVFYFIRAKDANEQKEKKHVMINSMIGLFVAVAVWGIIRIAGNVFGINTSDPNIDTPTGVTCPPGLRWNAVSGTCQRL